MRSRSARLRLIASIATVHHLQLETLLPSLKAALSSGGKLIILDLTKYEYPKDILREVISVALNWIFQRLKNSNIKLTQEEIQAWKEHSFTDEYFTLTEAKKIYLNFLKKSKIKKHLFWRYSVVWYKPLLSK